ncbi:MAG TPA: hypothetical protein VFW54_07640, partial [Propionibacteriaceae bacterium]|nr:hypothetical protein [Propionibacteriaceae bacterium]
VQSSSTGAAVSPSLGLDRSGFKEGFRCTERKASDEDAQRVLDKITSVHELVSAHRPGHSH